MPLKEFSLICPVIESADVFQAIETLIPPEVIEQALGHTNSVEQRKRKLPSQLVVCLVIAMQYISVSDVQSLKIPPTPLKKLPCTHKWSLSQFPSEEDRLKLPQTMNQSGHSRGTLGAITRPPCQPSNQPRCPGQRSGRIRILL